MDERIIVGLIVGAVIGGISMIYNYGKESFNSYTDKREEQKLQKIKDEIDNKPINKANKSIQTLEELKESGVISDEEFEQKTSKLRDEIKLEQVKETDEYKKLKELLNKGILTKEEFDSKIKLLCKSKTTDFNFRVVDGFSEGLGLAINSDLDYGFVDENNNIIIDFIFDHAENFIDGRAKVLYKNENKYINKNGEFIK